MSSVEREIRNLYDKQCVAGDDLVCLLAELLARIEALEDEVKALKEHPNA